MMTGWDSRACGHGVKPWRAQRWIERRRRMRSDGTLAAPQCFMALQAAEKYGRRQPCTAAMQRRWLPQAVVVAASLFVMMWAPPSAAATPCETLLGAIIGHGYYGRENPVKPKDVWATLRASIINVGVDSPVHQASGHDHGTMRTSHTQLKRSEQGIVPRFNRQHRQYQQLELLRPQQLSGWRVHHKGQVEE